jgi:cobalt/nickel transport system permease protein
MPHSIDKNIADLVNASGEALGSSPIHKLDPRAKSIVVLLFVAAVTSFGKYEVSRLMPFVFYPVAITALSGVRAGTVVKRTLLAAPFILLVGLFNPLFDREPLLRIGSFVVTGGWLSFLSIMLRAFFAVSGAVLLVLTTRFDHLCLGLEKMGVPQVFVTQLQFLYRYIGLLAGEAQRMLRAHDLRSGKNDRKISLSTYAPMLGTMLLRALDRATRIHRSMLSRGFDGEVRLLQPLSFKSTTDGLFILVWGGFFLMCRFVNLPELLFFAVTGR